MTTTVVVKLHSPQGFGNQGTFMYGTEAQFFLYFDHTPLGPDAVLTDISKHRSVDAAAGRAEREAKSASRTYKARGDQAWLHFGPVPDTE